MDLRVATGKKASVFVGDIHFGEQGTRGEINGFRGAGDLAIKFFTGILAQFEIRAETRANGGGVDLRNVDEHADGIGLRQSEKQLGSAAVAGIDEVADVNVALGDDAAEGRFDTFEGFEILQAANIGFVRL